MTLLCICHLLAPPSFLLNLTDKHLSYLFITFNIKLSTAPAAFSIIFCSHPSTSFFASVVLWFPCFWLPFPLFLSSPYFFFFYSLTLPKLILRMVHAYSRNQEWSFWGSSKVCISFWVFSDNKQSFGSPTRKTNKKTIIKAFLSDDFFFQFRYRLLRHVTQNNYINYVEVFVPLLSFSKTQ